MWPNNFLNTEITKVGENQASLRAIGLCYNKNCSYGYLSTTVMINPSGGYTNGKTWVTSEWSIACLDHKRSLTLLGSIENLEGFFLFAIAEQRRTLSRTKELH